MLKTGDQLSCIVALSPLRVEASDRAEMCTQALAGETAECIEKGEKDWIRIQLHRDGYEGWVDRKQWGLVSSGTRQFLIQAPVSSWMRSDGVCLELLAGSEVGQGDGSWHLGPWSLEPLDSPDLIFAAHDSAIDVAKQFLGAPYLWGGKSAFGIDCSGLTQLSFGLVGFNVPRDAKDQAKLGEAVPWGSQRPGDVAFFANAEQRVIHVGILTDPRTIVHAAGEVRADELTREGILRDGVLTHALDSIRRWPLSC